jgi:hemoglobin-like flavoprotein
MTPTQVRLVESSWAQVAPIRVEAAALFHGRLFELDPRLRSMFPAGMDEQGRRLMAVLGTAVAGLRRPGRLLPMARELGRRHAACGIKESDYDTVAAALLWTLGQGLGAAFTPDVRAAWTRAYDLLAGAMKEAASSEAA